MVLQSEPLQMQTINFLDFHLSVPLLKHTGYGIIHSKRSEVPFLPIYADFSLAAFWLLALD
jgi:hypothetical protein